MRRALDALVDAPAKAWSNPSTLNRWFDFGDESLLLARLLWVLFSSDCARFGCVDASDIHPLFDGENARMFEVSVNAPWRDRRATDDSVTQLLIELNGQRTKKSLLSCQVWSDHQLFAVEQLHDRLDLIDGVIAGAVVCVAVARGMPHYAAAYFGGAAVSDILLVSR